ncbi:exocyst complex component Sec10-domain-containing protein, partial [Kalaharituber pfeilii]
EIISKILDHLPVSDLMSFARVCRRLKEMIYEDSRWIQKLKDMGVWNEAEARQRYEEAIAARNAELHRQREAAGLKGPKGIGSDGRPRPDSMTIFDIAEEERRQKQAREEEERRRLEMERRRNTMAIPPETGVSLQNSPNLISMSSPIIPQKSHVPPVQPPGPILSVFRNIVSARGYARYEYAKIHGALAPFYFNLAKARTHTDPILFRQFREPEEQAIMLAQLRIFAKADSSQGWKERLDRLESMTSIFENAALREFEGGYEAQDIDGRMKRYAQVLIHLNGGQACIQLFVQKHPVMFERERLGNPMDCFDGTAPGILNTQPSLEFFTRLSDIINEQSNVIERVFPDNVNVMSAFLERVSEDVVGEYVTPLLDEAHERGVEVYLKGIGAIFAHLRQFSNSIKRPKGSGSEERFRKDVWQIMARVFEPHVDLYLQEELDYFRKKAQDVVDEWGKKVSEADAATVSLLMSNVSTREADKRDFLSTFKKVILLPVQAIPLAPFGNKSSQSTTTYTTKSLEASTSNLTIQDQLPSRSSTPGIPSRASTPVPPSVPTTELAAKAAIMNSRLEGIRSLFSIEVALKLVHSAKASLERAAQFAKIEGQTGEEAKEQCEAIFITLLQVLGTSHIKTGFDKALAHLAAYNPRDVSHNSLAVAPLVTFLELVNIGDLIQQMVDVFYEQELVAQKLTDKNDFLNPAAKEKKRFEKMLDEMVAAGLDRGIDVLINEVDYLFATTQQSTDFNPGAITAPGSATTSGSGTPGHHSSDFDIGPTKTALRIVETVSSHTALLNGLADKNVLDVFNHEVGMRLFTSLCKHIKRQRISVDGAVKLISDINHYHSFITTLHIKHLVPSFNALRELSQIYLIDATHAKQMAAIIADTSRFGGIFRVEEVYEYAERREDWFRVKKEVEKAMYGFGLCLVM